jgi:hypothetical protein
MTMNKKHAAKLATAIAKVRLVLNDATIRNDETALKLADYALKNLQALQSPSHAAIKGALNTVRDQYATDSAKAD